MSGLCCLKKSPKDVIVISGSTNFESNRFEFKSSAWCGAIFKLLHLVREHHYLCFDILDGTTFGELVNFGMPCCTKIGFQKASISISTALYDQNGSISQGSTSGLRKVFYTVRLQIRGVSVLHFATSYEFTFCAPTYRPVPRTKHTIPRDTRQKVIQNYGFINPESTNCAHTYRPTPKTKHAIPRDTK
jgi:hypothetical protein